VYCLSRRSADTLSAFLCRRGTNAAVYHAGMDAEERAETQELFARRELLVIVATVAFGMGIDRADVRFVVHRDLPASIEAYYQEIGRGGRDGLAADCVLFHSWSDVRIRDVLSSGLPPDRRRHARRQARRLFRLVSERDCRHRAICGHFGETSPPCHDSCDICSPELARDVVRACAQTRPCVGTSGSDERVAAALGAARLLE
jgi:ATP-dependent DNA helicase RecQ